MVVCSPSWGGSACCMALKHTASCWLLLAGGRQVGEHLALFLTAVRLSRKPVPACSCCCMLCWVTPVMVLVLLLLLIVVVLDLVMLLHQLLPVTGSMPPRVPILWR